MTSEASIVLLALLLPLVTAPQGAAQETPWQRSPELGANVWCGAAHSRVLSSALEIGHGDSSLSVRTNLRFGYADEPRDGRASRGAASDDAASSCSGCGRTLDVGPG